MYWLKIVLFSSTVVLVAVLYPFSCVLRTIGMEMQERACTKIPFRSNHDELAIRQVSEKAGWTCKVPASADLEILK